jgi:hypothetical protein
MDESALQSWLAAYGQAWERKDTKTFVMLFAPDVRYHWTPFEEPKQGREQLAQAVELAVGRQEAIKFSSKVLCVDGQKGLAHWHCSFDRAPTGQRVDLDGIFEMEFDADGRCSVFREWWHSNEAT